MKAIQVAKMLTKLGIPHTAASVKRTLKIVRWAEKEYAKHLDKNSDGKDIYPSEPVSYNRMIKWAAQGAYFLKQKKHLLDIPIYTNVYIDGKQLVLGGGLCLHCGSLNPTGFQHQCRGQPCTCTWKGLKWERDEQCHLHGHN